MGNLVGSTQSGSRSSGTKKNRFSKALKRLKKLGTKDTCTGESSESETIDNVQTDTGLAAWQACAGSVVLTTAISVINFTTHEAVRSLNEDFRNAEIPIPQTTPPILDCYTGIRQYFNTIINIYIIGRNAISNICNPSELTGEQLHLCLLRNYLEFHGSTSNQYCIDLTAEQGFTYYYPCLYYNGLAPTTNGTVLFVDLCSSLWPPAETFINSNNPQTSRLIAVENLFSATLHTADEEKLFGDTLNYIFVSLGLSFILVGAVISVYCGYRVVSIIGSVLVAIGFFFATFIDTDDGAPVQLLVGGIAGIGAAFLRLSAVVAVLEYFKELRMRVIVFSGLGAVLINFLLIGITFVDDAEFYWKTVFRFQLLSAVVSLIISFIMKPLLLVTESVEKPLDELKDRVEENKDEVTCITKLSEYVFARDLFTNKVFYLVLALYFFDQLGRPIFTEGVQPMIIERQYDDNELKIKLQPLVENIGALIGLGVLLLIPNNQSKKAKLKESRNPSLILQARNVTILAILNIVIGLVCMHMPSVKSYPLTLVYSAIFGFTEGMFNSLVQDFVPEGFGRRHIRMMAGFLGFVAGVGSVIAGAVADGMQQNASNPHSAYYVCGVSLLISGTLSVVTRFVVMRDAKLQERLRKEQEREKQRKEKEKVENGDRMHGERQRDDQVYANQALSTNEIQLDLRQNDVTNSQTVTAEVEDSGNMQQSMSREGNTESQETTFQNS